MQLGEGQFEPYQTQPKTIRFCKACQQETPHEVREGGGVVAKLCIPCMERTLYYELDRD